MIVLSAVVQGIIPTRVGTRFHLKIICILLQDHPHACGDKRARALATRGGWGSSPRVWGQVATFDSIVICMRIIPTRVGTRGDMLSISPRWNNHPHACGDKRANREKCKYKLGSSPRVWGQESVKCVDDDSTRIIPTRVGTSFNVYECVCLLQDHPHACGDKLLTTA